MKCEPMVGRTQGGGPVDPDGHASEALPGPETWPVFFQYYSHQGEKRLTWPFTPKPERQENKMDCSSHRGLGEVRWVQAAAGTVPLRTDGD